jgi:hypothetical protein
MKSLFTLQSPLNDSLFSPFPSLTETSAGKKVAEKATPVGRHRSGAGSVRPGRKRSRKVLDEIVNDKSEEIVNDKSDKIVNGRSDKMVNHDKSEEIVNDKSDNIINGRSEEIVNDKSEKIVNHGKSDEIVIDKSENGVLRDLDGIEDVEGQRSDMEEEGHGSRIGTEGQRTDVEKFQGEITSDDRHYTVFNTTA